ISPRCPDALHFLGLVRHRRGDNGQAVALMRQSIEVAPDVASFHVNYGEVLRVMGRSDEAAERFHAELRLQPGNAQACNNLGVVYDSKGQTREALSWYERAIRARADYPKAHWHRALSLLREGRYGD